MTPEREMEIRRQLGEGRQRMARLQAKWHRIRDEAIPHDVQIQLDGIESEYNRIAADVKDLSDHLDHALYGGAP